MKSEAPETSPTAERQPPPQSSSPPAAPHVDSSGSRVVSPRIVSPEQLREQGRRARDQEIQEENVLRNRAGDEREKERLRLQAQGVSLQEQESRLRELDRKEHARRWEVEQKMREEKVARDIAELTANKHKVGDSGAYDAERLA